MESIIGTEQAVTLGAFANAAALEKALCEHKIDVAAWDRNGAKGVTQLLSELENGESVLNVESGRVTRCLRVVKVRALPVPPAVLEPYCSPPDLWSHPPCHPHMPA